MKTISKWGLSLILLACANAHSAPPPERALTRDEFEKKIEAVEKRLAEKTDALEKRGLELKFLEDKIEIKKEFASAVADARKNALEIGQSNVTWWLAAMAIILTVIALIVPFFLLRFRTDYEKALASARAAAADAEKDRQEIANLLSDAEKKHKEISDYQKTVRERGSSLLTAKANNTDTDSEKVKKAVREVSTSEEAPLATRLYASGLDAATKSDWSRAAAFFAAADASEPNNAETLFAWGVALARRAHDAIEPERTRFLDHAELKLTEASAITGVTHYNLACIAAMRGNAAKFVEIADSLPAGALPDKAHIDTDKDLNGIRNTPEFQAWYARTFPGNNR
jgi:hypothetical protein